jgi:hypothetical protein
MKLSSNALTSISPPSLAEAQTFNIDKAGASSDTPLLAGEPSGTRSGQPHLRGYNISINFATIRPSAP